MFTQHQLISRRYLNQQREMHQEPRPYGNRGELWAPTVIDLARKYRAHSILDYGAGRGRLAGVLREEGLVCRNYDPGVVAFSQMPSFADMVVCTDVLEHVEPDRLEAVLAHIRLLARKVVFLVVATRPAAKRLPNGDNAHLIIESDTWWEERIVKAGFTLQEGPAVWPDQPRTSVWVGVVTP